jgi:ring-1,2-phenylacetyl-CoA epoxidase subunit PaaD
MVTETKIWEWLEDVFDPEVPVLSVVDLGVVRKVNISPEEIKITITPTYSGCPAMRVIEEDIRRKLLREGVMNLKVETVLSPAWTTDWISEKGRQNLKEYGIAPPENEVDKSLLFSKPLVVPCPNCNSRETKMVSEFGSTSCKAHYNCLSCKEPFDYFKCLR